MYGIRTANVRANMECDFEASLYRENKISEIQLNGDGQRIKLPPNLIRKNQVNEITIKTGRNLMQTAYIDYDDIEFMNLSIQTE